LGHGGWTDKKALRSNQKAIADSFCGVRGICFPTYFKDLVAAAWMLKVKYEDKKVSSA
jgi:hypothetical protein